VIVRSEREGKTEAETIVTHLDAGDEIERDNDAFAGT
jgi:predicted type IV restriction endonuclease